MDAKEFIALLGNHDKVKDKSVEELKKLSLEFPYSQPVQLLYTIRLGQSSEYLFNRQLGKTSVLTNDRTVLFDLFEREEDTVIESAPAPPVVRKMPAELEMNELEEEEMPREDEGRVEHSVLSAVTDEERVPQRPGPAADKEDRGDEDQNLKDKVRAILEENRRLREKYEGSQKENSAINQRISEIKERLDKIKLSKEETKEDTRAEPEEVVPPEPRVEAFEQSSSELTLDGDVYSADEEALLEEHRGADEAGPAEELMAETGSVEAKPDDKEETVFTIEDETETFSKAGDEELPFSAWIHRLSEPPGRAQEEPEEVKNEEETLSEEPEAISLEPECEEPEKSEPEERPGLTAKFELFDSFVEKLPELKRRKPENLMNRRQEEDLSEEESSLVTETLAKVYVKQKHYDKAIKAYEILRLKYPEKSGFFADRIFEIKKLSNS